MHNVQVKTKETLNNLKMALFLGYLWCSLEHLELYIVTTAKSPLCTLEVDNAYHNTTVYTVYKVTVNILNSSLYTVSFDVDCFR